VIIELLTEVIERPINHGQITSGDISGHLREEKIFNEAIIPSPLVLFADFQGTSLTAS
jgi:hypothetical protein